MQTPTSSQSPVRARIAPGAGKGAALARLAAQLCEQETFQNWVVSRIGAAPQGVSDQQHAAQFVRDVCGIESRAELDHDANAATLFHAAVRRPFVESRGIYAA
jgi:hypothetical protein